MTASTTPARARVDRHDGPTATADRGDLGWGVLRGVAAEEFVLGELEVLVCGVSVGDDLGVLVCWDFGVLLNGGSEVPSCCGLGVSE